MKGKDDIEKLFQEKLGNYQPKVNPKVWNGIQSGLGSAGTSAGGAASTLGLTGKIIVGAVVAAGLTVGGIFYFKNDKPVSKNIPVSQKKISSKNSPSKKIEKQKQEKQEPLFVKNTPQKENNKHEATKSTKGNKKKNSTSSMPVNSKKKQKEENNLNKEVSSVKNSGIPTANSVESNTNKTPSKTNTKSVVKTISPSKKSEEKNTTKQENRVKLNPSVRIAKQDNQMVYFGIDNLPKGATVKWNFGDGNISEIKKAEHFYSDAGTYTVLAKINYKNQTVTKKLTVRVKVKGEITLLPNIFTPNGDGHNDVFFIKSKNISSFHISILNQEQEVVYSSNNPNFRWKGFDLSGKKVEKGTYLYIITAKDTAGNEINKYKRLIIK